MKLWAIETTEELLDQTNTLARSFIVSAPICWLIIFFAGGLDGFLTTLWFGAATVVGFPMKYFASQFDRDPRKAIIGIERTYLVALVLSCIGPVVVFWVLAKQSHYVLAYMMLVLGLSYLALRAFATGRAIARAKCSMRTTEVVGD